MEGEKSTTDVQALVYSTMFKEIPGPLLNEPERTRLVSLLSSFSAHSKISDAIPLTAS